jgi:ribosomal protein S27E
VSAEDANLIRRFESGFSPEERSRLAEHLISGAFGEVPCAVCGDTLFAFSRAAEGTAAYECPACGTRTYVRQREGRIEVLSEVRLVRIVDYARRKRWSCSEHPGVAVEAESVQTDPREPLLLKIHYLCRRSRRFGRKRVHAGVLTQPALSLEAEMLAAQADRKGSED